MPKYYIQCGPDGKGVFHTEEEIEACFAIMGKIMANEEGCDLAPFMVVSEAGFLQDIRKWGDKKMSDEQMLYSTSSILRLMEMDDLADDLDEWCREQHNPILMKALADVKNYEDLDD
jgi:hypothetical protein